MPGQVASVTLVIAVLPDDPNWGAAGRFPMDLPAFPLTAAGPGKRMPRVSGNAWRNADAARFAFPHALQLIRRGFTVEVCSRKSYAFP